MIPGANLVYLPRANRAHVAIAGRTLCGRGPQWPDAWFGTGDQREYERAAALPLCTSCEQLAAVKVVAP